MPRTRSRGCTRSWRTPPPPTAAGRPTSRPTAAAPRRQPRPAWHVRRRIRGAAAQHAGGGHARRRRAAARRREPRLVGRRGSASPSPAAPTDHGAISFTERSTRRGETLTWHGALAAGTAAELDAAGVGAGRAHRERAGERRSDRAARRLGLAHGDVQRSPSGAILRADSRRAERCLPRARPSRAACAGFVTKSLYAGAKSSHPRDGAARIVHLWTWWRW